MTDRITPRSSGREPQTTRFPPAHLLRRCASRRRRIAALPADDWRRRSEEFREPQLTQHLELVERLRLVAARHDTTPGAVAVTWTLRNPRIVLNASTIAS